MSQSGFKATEIIDLDALANVQASSDHVVESIVSGQVGKTVAVGTGNGETATDLSSATNSLAPVTDNRGLTLPPLDLSRPVKTEGEASASMSTVSQPPPTGGASLLPVSQPSGTLQVGSPASTPGDASVSSSAGSLPASISNLGTFGSPLTTLGAQLNLTAEEQSAAYKKANIIALSALAKKGGPNARNMLAVQGKLQEFLTNLIGLAGNSGQELKSTVQMLVQQLVTGSISEQEFAMRIEKDLHSQHQPSLLPFLQSSVPHLRTRLQLQQAIMKELLQRQAQEKLQQKKVVGAQSGGAAVSLGNNSSAGNSVHRAPDNLAQINTSGTSSLAENSSIEPQSINQLQKANNSVSVNVSTPSSSTSSLSTSSSLSSSATASVPLPISTTSITAHLKEQLAKLTPQQRVLYMQQLTSSQAQKNSQLQQNQQSRLASTAASTATATPVPTTRGGLANAKVSISPLNSISSPAQTVKVATQSQINTNQPQQQKQPLSVGGVAVKQIISSRAMSLSSTTNHHLAGGKVVVGSNVSPSKGGGLRAGFVDVKLAPGPGGKLSSPPTSQTGKGKGKVKVEKSVADDEEEEDDDIDFSGVKTVNLQAESILPSHLGDTTMRTVRDEAFFDVQALRRKVIPIARRYGITEITEDYLVLLSHGIQERLKDIMEKVTVVSQHRTETLKDEGLYEVSSEVRGQLKVLESIDRLSHRRKMEREKDQILKAARSRSRPDDPEAAAKIKEQAKKLQQEEAQKIRDKRANEAALAALSAIGSGTKRKRPTGTEGTSSSLSGQDTGSGPSLLGTQTSRQPKRRITARDLLFYMEQTRETKKSLVLYKSLLK